MAIVDVLGGGIDKKVIEFDPKMERFCTGLISLSSYPFSEITKTNIISEHGKFIVVDVLFGESLNIHVRLKVDQYKSLCQCIDRYQEEPTGVELPIREISAIPWVWGAVVVLFAIIGLVDFEPETQNVIMPNKEAWKECMAHAHWDEFQERHGYLETVDRKFRICGDEP